MKSKLAFLSLPVIGWILYDFANTIFSYAVITRYFNDYIVNELSQPDYVLGIMSAAVSVLLIATLPTLGAIADAWGRRKPLVVGFTIACVIFTALLTFVSTPLIALIIGGAAIFCFSSGLAHYDPLLSKVAPPERRAQISGFGTGAGYLGVGLATVIFSMLVSKNQDAFIPTAIMFLVFSLPFFFWVKEKNAKGKVEKGIVRKALGEVRHAIKHARERSYGSFLLARFLYVDAVSVTLSYMVLVSTRFGLGDKIDILLPIAILFSVISAIVAGQLVKRYGPKPVLSGVIGLFAITLLLTGIIGTAGILWLTGPMVGVALGAVWTSDRVLLLGLCEESHRGEAFGLYSLVGKVSSGVGPLVFWGGTVWLTQELGGSVLSGTRIALIVLAVVAFFGLLLLQRVPHVPGDQIEAQGPAPSTP